MSNSLNIVQLIGNMTADAEIRETQTGIKVASFSIATNQVWKDQSWVKQEKVDFHNIVAWKGLADIVEKYTSKGKKLYIQWRLQTRSWDDQAWVKRYRTEIVADNIILLGVKKDWDSHEGSVSEWPEEDIVEKPRKAHPKVDTEISIEDIPFR